MLGFLRRPCSSDVSYDTHKTLKVSLIRSHLTGYTVCQPGMETLFIIGSNVKRRERSKKRYTVHPPQPKAPLPKSVPRVGLCQTIFTIMKQNSAFKTHSVTYSKLSHTAAAVGRLSGECSTMVLINLSKFESSTKSPVIKTASLRHWIFF